MTNGEKIMAMFPHIKVRNSYYTYCVEVKLEYHNQHDTGLLFDKKWWNAEYKEPTIKNDLGVDCISRDDVWDVMQELWGTSGELMDRLMALPPVTPQPRKGHWKAFIHSAYHGTDEDGEPVWREVTVYHCSQCNRRTVIKEKFCPNCGAKMVEPQERESDA